MSYKTDDDFDVESATLAIGILLLMTVCVLFRKCEKALIEVDVPVARARPLPTVFSCPHCDQLIEIPTFETDSESDYGSDSDESFV